MTLQVITKEWLLSPEGKVWGEECAQRWRDIHAEAFRALVFDVKAPKKPKF